MQMTAPFAMLSEPLLGRHLVSPSALALFTSSGQAAVLGLAAKLQPFAVLLRAVETQFARYIGIRIAIIFLDLLFGKPQAFRGRDSFNGYSVGVLPEGLVHVLAAAGIYLTLNSTGYPSEVHHRGIKARSPPRRLLYARQQMMTAQSFAR